MKHKLTLLFTTVLFLGSTSYLTASCKKNNDQQPVINVNTGSINLKPTQNSSDSILVMSNTSWTAGCNADWLTITTTAGTNNQTITVTASQNNTTGQRLAEITIMAAGAKDQTLKVNVTQLGIPCGSNDETPCPVAGCNVPIMPLYESLTDNHFLPDPFTFLNGQRMTTKAEWECRSAEIAMLAQEFEYGYKPCTPYESTTGAFADNNITVTVTENGKTVSFNCSITYPSAGSAPYPAIISLGWFCLNRDEILNLGIAIINFPNDDIGLQVDGASRGKGKFYDLHCNTHSAGALMAWAWGVSRLIDALEKTPAVNIDTKHLGVTGCSRNGKGALCAGAFDNRIALTIPQESGSGGAANWRVSDYMGSSVQRLTQIVDENCWFRSNFKQFKRTATKLPFDHHMIAALCAPRGLLFIENTSQTWLGNESCWATGNVTSMIYQALGIADNMGFSQNGHSDHCGFPDAQIPELVAFVKKFLLNNNTVDTHVLKTDGSFTFDKNKWINWDIPELK